MKPSDNTPLQGDTQPPAAGEAAQHLWHRFTVARIEAQNKTARAILVENALQYSSAEKMAAQQSEAAALRALHLVETEVEAACNSHAALIAALNDCLDAMEGECPHYLDTINKAYAALAQTKPTE